MAIEINDGYDAMNTNTEQVINNTLAELSLIFVFIFALFPAIALAVGDSKSRTASQAIASIGGDSCLWIPRSDLPSEIGNVVTYLSDDQRDLAGTNLFLDDNSQPVPRSFLQIFWQREGKTIIGPDDHGAAFTVVLNIDSSQKPYIYLDETARRAVGDAIKMLASDDAIFEFPVRVSSNVVTYTLKRQDIARNSIDPYRIIEKLRYLVDHIYETYECRLLIDFMNFPITTELAPPSEPHQGFFEEAALFRNAMANFYSHGISKLPTGVNNGYWWFLGTRTVYPESEDKTN